MNREIGSFDAKTKWSELLRNVQAGQRYTITMRGEPVADLVPCEGARRPFDPATAVEDMRQFMKQAPRTKGLNIKELIEDGRA